MRKLLIMASLFYPQKKGGGPVISLMNLVQRIYREFDIRIISHNHEVGEKEPLPGIENGWKDTPYGKVYYVPYGENTVKKIYSLIDEIHPDIIYQNSFFSYDYVLPVLQYKRKHKNVGVLIAPRGEMCENRFNDGRLKKTCYTSVLRMTGMLRNIYFQATGADEMTDMLRNLGIQQKWIVNINNITYADQRYVKAIEKKPNELRLCFISRIQDTKNLLYAVERLAQVSGIVAYDVYGSIENKEYFDRCFSVPLPDNIHLNFKGLLDHEDVARTISSYHACFLPTIGENYGHAIVEALLYHRPVIISDKTPWNGINEAKCGFAIPLSDKEGFVSAIEAMCVMDNSAFQIMCDKAAAFVEKELQVDDIVAKYIEIFNEV